MQQRLHLKLVVDRFKCATTHFNGCCFIAVAYTTSETLHAVFMHSMSIILTGIRVKGCCCWCWLYWLVLEWKAAAAVLMSCSIVLLCWQLLTSRRWLVLQLMTVPCSWTTLWTSRRILCMNQVPAATWKTQPRSVMLPWSFWVCAVLLHVIAMEANSEVHVLKAYCLWTCIPSWYSWQMTNPYQTLIPHIAESAFRKTQWWQQLFNGHFPGQPT